MNIDLEGMQMNIDLEELLELIAMHGRTLIDVCDVCGTPVKSEMLVKVERMRELVLMLPDHVEADYPDLGRTMQ